jgi:hypothetical protein
MSSYTQVFGGSTIYPSDVSYLALSLISDTTLQWPLEANVGNNLVARIIDVTPTGAFAITMPPADQTGVGQTVLFNNIGPSTITIKDNDGNTLLSIAQGLQWQLYLTDNSTAAGVWRSYQMGASTAQAQASALAGYGLTATNATLSQSTPVTLFNSDYTAGIADRAKAFVWTAGLGVFTLPSASAVGDNWFVAVRNGGTGDLTIDPQGLETVNDAASLTLQPGDSATLMTDGINWYTLGLGQDATFAFDYTSINVAGLSGNYVLGGSELNRIAYQFTGALAGDIDIVVPKTVQQYWVYNNTTGGSYTLRVKTSTQTPGVLVARGARAILYCDGSVVVSAETGGIATPVAILDGGTGATTAGGALINLGGTTTGIGLFTAASTSLARTALAAAASGANSDITSLSGLTTPLSVAQGGTGSTSVPTNGQLLIGNGTGYSTAAITAGSGISVTNGSGTITITNAASSFDPTANNTFTGRQTFTGSTTALAAVFNNIAETTTVSATAATGTINYDVTTQSVVYYTAAASGNWTLNLRGNGTTSLNTLLSTGQSITVAFLVTQGSPAYYNNVVQVDGTATGVTTRWQGGTAPTAGNASSIDVYTYTVIKTGSATFTVLASQTKY